METRQHSDQKDLYQPNTSAGGTTPRSRLRATLRSASLAVTLTVLASSALAQTAPQLFGVNLSGGDSTGGSVPGTYGTDYIYPNDAELAYYQDKGLTLIRLPVKWRRIQAALYDPLNATDMARIDTVIGYARNRDMKVIIDLHDYNEYKIGTTTYLVGSTEVPHSALADLWGQLANRYKNETAVYGYDIMNEPKGTAANWKTEAQAVIDAIRNYDDDHWILIEGVNYSHAWGWEKDGNGILADLDDTWRNRLIFSAHSYWDKGGSGIYANSYAADSRYPEVGITNVQPFVAWCQTNNLRGLIGEYGVPWDKGYVAEWNTVCDNFMNYIKANGMSGTYWAGGPWMQNYSLSCEPTNNFTGDKPVMSVLENYNNTSVAAEVIVDNSDSGSVTLTGSWAASTSTSGYYGANYLHDGNTSKGGKSVKFTPNLSAGGDYEVFARWTAAANRAVNVPVTIACASGNVAGPALNQQLNGGTWMSLGNYTFNAGTGGGVTIANNGTTGYVIADAVKFSPAVGLPAGWSMSDVGAVGVAGSSTYGSGVYTVNGSGITIGGTADSFHYLYMDGSGDCTITARVASQSNTHGYARAGVMIRDGLAANARVATAILTPANGSYMQSRLTTGGTLSSVSGGTGVAPYWVRLTRVGNNFTAYKSVNGSTWVQIGTTKTITMATSVKIGFAVCSYANSVLGTATFDNVTVSP